MRAILKKDMQVSSGEEILTWRQLQKKLITTEAICLKLIRENRELRKQAEKKTQAPLSVLEQFEMECG